MTKSEQRHSPRGGRDHPGSHRAGERALILLIVLLGTILRVYQLGTKGFWSDEIWSAQRSGMTARQIIEFFLDNTVGPWTYLAGRASLSLLGADQEAWLREVVAQPAPQ